MTVHRLFGACAALLLIAACQGAGSVPPLADLGDYTHVEVRRIGDYDQGHLEFHDHAMARAFAIMDEAGIAPGRVLKVTISTPPSQEEAGFGATSGFVFFRLWVRVEDCDKNILFVAGPGGAIRTYDDPGRCMTGG